MCASTTKVSIFIIFPNVHLCSNMTIASLYKSLGIDSKTILALAAVWGTCAFISNAIAVVYLPDRLGRRK